MIWLLALAVLCWKPLYYLVRYFQYRKKDANKAKQNLDSIKIWFGVLWSLVKWP